MQTRVVAQNSGRADSVLAELVDVSRGYIQKLIKKKGVKVNGKTLSKPSSGVAEGDILVISKNVVKGIEGEKIALDKLLPEKIDFKIVYEDKDVLIVDKPSGLVVHPAHACPSGTLLNGVLYYLRSIPPEAGREPARGALKENEQTVTVELPKPVNRIDKDTSGLVVIAKNESAHLALSKQFENRKVEKWYQAIVFGDFSEVTKPVDLVEKYGVNYAKEGKTVEFGTWLNRSHIDRRRVVVADSGRWALSRFTPIKINKIEMPVKVGNAFIRPPKTYQEEPKSWLKIQILTGRTHQIRAQLKSLGFTLVGDPMYSNKRYKALSSSLFEKVGESARLLLHSWKLTLCLPDGKPHTFEAKIPEVFKRVYEA